MDIIFQIVPVCIFLGLGYALGYLDWCLPDIVRRHPKKRNNTSAEWEPTEKLQQLKKKR